MKKKRTKNVSIVWVLPELHKQNKTATVKPEIFYLRFCLKPAKTRESCTNSLKSRKFFVVSVSKISNGTFRSPGHMEIDIIIEGREARHQQL